VALADACVLGAELSAGGIAGLVCATPDGAVAARAALPAITSQYGGGDRHAALMDRRAPPASVRHCCSESGSRRPASSGELEKIGEQLPASAVRTDSG